MLSTGLFPKCASHSNARTFENLSTLKEKCIVPSILNTGETGRK